MGSSESSLPQASNPGIDDVTGQAVEAWAPLIVARNVPSHVAIPVDSMVASLAKLLDAPETINAVHFVNCILQFANQALKGQLTIAGGFNIDDARVRAFAFTSAINALLNVSVAQWFTHTCVMRSSLLPAAAGTRSSGTAAGSPCPRLTRRPISPLA
jgi:hypothetical protein